MKSFFSFLIVLTSLSIAAVSLPAQWIRQNSGVDATLTGVVMLSPTTAIAVGNNGSILRTVNAGSTWIDVAAPLSFIRPWSGVSFYDSLNGIVVGDHGVVLTTSNGGINWIWHQIPNGGNCLSALHTGPNTICVGADSGWVYTTNDAGKTWTSEKISAWPIRSLFTYRGPSTEGVSKYALTPNSLCAQYTIPSFGWTESMLTNFRGLGSEACDAEFCNGGGAGFMVGVQGDLRAEPTIVRKSLSDSVWRQVPTPGAHNGILLGVSAHSAAVIYVCGSDGMIFKSSNGGDTWIDQSIATHRNIRSIYFYDELRGIAVGDSGLIHTLFADIPVSVKDRSPLLPTQCVLEQNFPNPFNPSTTFTFSIPVGAKGKTSLHVYDLCGREVARLFDEESAPGSYSLRWNAEDISGGIYFYRLRTGNRTETRKLLLIK